MHAKNTLQVFKHFNQQINFDHFINIFKYFIKGSRCESLVNFCTEVGNLCSLYPSLFNMTCQSLNKTEQLSTGLTYTCNGTCSSTGFSRNRNSACVGKNFNSWRYFWSNYQTSYNSLYVFKDINECENETICKNGSKCVNEIGNYYCDCDDGYKYVNDTCQCNIFYFKWI